MAKLRVRQAAEILRTALKKLPTLAAKVKRGALPGMSVRRRASQSGRPARIWRSMKLNRRVTNNDPGFGSADE